MEIRHLPSLPTFTTGHRAPERQVQIQQFQLRTSLVPTAQTERITLPATTRMTAPLSGNLLVPPPGTAKSASPLGLATYREIDAFRSAAGNRSELLNRIDLLA